jgi:hypothetical protein
MGQRPKVDFLRRRALRCAVRFAAPVGAFRLRRLAFAHSAIVHRSIQKRSVIDSEKSTQVKAMKRPVDPVCRTRAQPNSDTLFLCFGQC